MTSTLERRYRRLLLSYPRAYRDNRGEELLGTLMELSRPGQRWPAVREARALVLGGVRARAGIDQVASTAQAWLDAARTALVLLLTLQVVVQVWLVEIARGDEAFSGPDLWQLLGGPVVTGVIAGSAALAWLTGSRRLGFVLALLTPVPAVLPPFNNTWDTLYVFEVVSWWLPVIALAVPLLRRPATPQPWRWLLAMPLLLIASALLPLAGQWFMAVVAALAMFAACLVWAVVVDPRPALALGLLSLTVIPQFLASVVLIALPVVVIAGCALLSTGALLARHRTPV